MADQYVPIFDWSDTDERPLANAGVVTYPPGATYGPRVQRDYQLMLVHAGAARVTIDAASRPIPAGHVGLLLPGHTERFAFAPDHATRHSWIAVAPNALDDDARATLDAAPTCLPLSGAMRDCVELGHGTADVDEHPRRPLLAAVGQVALALYAAEARRVATSREHPAVACARALARRRAIEGIGVRDLARAVGISEEHLVRLFRRDLGVTPGAFLRAERLAHAAYLLEHSGLPVADVARRSGFASPPHFARLLRAATGMTPSELRARRWIGSAPNGGTALRCGATITDS